MKEVGGAVSEQADRAEEGVGGLGAAGDVGVQDRRLVQPDTLNEEGRLGDDTATIGTLAGDGDAAHLRGLGVAPGGANAPSSVAVPARLAAAWTRIASSIGVTPAGSAASITASEKTAPPAAHEWSWMGVTAAPIRVLRSSCTGRHGNIRATPLPSGRASRQSKVGEQASAAVAATNAAAAPRTPGRRARVCMCRLSALADNHRWVERPPFRIADLRSPPHGRAVDLADMTDLRTSPA